VSTSLRSIRPFSMPDTRAWVPPSPRRPRPGWRAGGAAPRPGGTSGFFSSHAVVRTRFYDDCLLDAAGDGLRQVVLLAVGLDTRAYRLAWPEGLRLFELDLPGVLRFKTPCSRAAGGRPVSARRRSGRPAGRPDRGAYRRGLPAGRPDGLAGRRTPRLPVADEATRLLTAIGDPPRPTVGWPSNVKTSTSTRCARGTALRRSGPSASSGAPPGTSRSTA
jgi:hypothetical protein